MRLSLALPLLALALNADAAAANTLPSKAEVAAYADKLLADSYPADGPGAAVLVARGDA